MAADGQDRKENEDKLRQILDFAEAWKKMYFETETTLAKAIDDYVASDSFTSFLEKMGAEYLSLYKTSNQNMERFFANSPVPSKKDVARVAELVINIEEKVDTLDVEVSAGLNSVASSMMKLIEFQGVLKDEMIALRQEVQSLQKQLKAMQTTAGAAGTEKPVRSRSRKTTGEDAATAGEKEDTNGSAVTAADKAPRPRTRKKKEDQ